jgi:hypothetical protein
MTSVADDVGRTFRQLEAPPAPQDARGERVLGKPALDRFLRRDWALDDVDRWIRHSNAPTEALHLADIALRPWDALKQLLPSVVSGSAGFDVVALRTFSEYADVYTGHAACALLPLMLLCQDAGSYAPTDSALRPTILAARRVGETLDELAGSYKGKEDPSPRKAPALARVLQVQLGSGYQTERSLQEGDSCLAWQFIELVNGDLLLLAGYEWFSFT